jgi:hypothetical protein
MLMHKPAAGAKRRDTWFVIETVPMAQPSFDELERWAFGIDRLRHGHLGKMDMRRDSSARSGGNALTTSLCLENGTFGIC